MKKNIIRKKKNFKEDPKQLKISTFFKKPSDNLTFSASSQTIPVIDNVEEDVITFSSDEEPDPQTRFKRLKKCHSIAQPLLQPESPPSILKLKGLGEWVNPDDLPSNIKITVRDESDNEGSSSLHHTDQVKLTDLPSDCVQIGLYAKLLATVYLRKLDETANIFLPFYYMVLLQPDGSEEIKKDFFRTKKNAICVFASGGLHNIWEKSVGHMLSYFHLGEKIKIIRYSWIQKHLYKEKKISRNIKKEFEGRETELHSEFYYDIFLHHFFPPQQNLKSLTIYAYSWWEICDGCENKLSTHNNLFNMNTPLTYKIAASRRYRHHYPVTSVVTNYLVPSIQEKHAWKIIWTALLNYANKQFENEAAKEKFWTQTKEGLEISKWLGQAFIENTVAPNGRKEKPLSKGDVLKFFAEENEQEINTINLLLTYLRKKNWELSCWYKPPYYPESVQKKWKQYWRQLVIPHFGWEVVYESDKSGDDLDAHCEMCGNTHIRQFFLVFHSKFRLSDQSLPSTQSAQATADFILQQKRKQSLCVGSECVKVLISSYGFIKEWRRKYSYEQQELKWAELESREADNEKLDAAERQLAKRAKRSRNSF